MKIYTLLVPNPPWKFILCWLQTLHGNLYFVGSKPSEIHYWGSTWGMKFNANKCNFMRVSRSRKPLQHFYSLGSEILQEVSDAKYPGIQIDNKLD